MLSHRISVVPSWHSNEEKIAPTVLKPVCTSINFNLQIDCTLTVLFVGGLEICHLCIKIVYFAENYLFIIKD